MNNKLYVKFENNQEIFVFFVGVGCTLKEAIEDIQAEATHKIEKASYNKSDLQ